MMKRIIALLLAAVMLCSFSFTAAAGIISARSDDLREGSIVILHEGSQSIENVLISGDTLLMPIDRFENYTRYHYYESNNAYVLGGGNFRFAFKWLQADTVNKRIMVVYGSNSMYIDADKMTEYNGTLYLPMDVMLACMDCYAAENNGVLTIDSEKDSLAEILYDFQPGYYDYNFYEESGGNEMALSAFTALNYLYDSVTNLRFKRLDIFSKSGEADDYATAFENLLTDNETYLKAAAESEHWFTGSMHLIEKLFKSADGVDFLFNVAEKYGFDEGAWLEYAEAIEEIFGGDMTKTLVFMKDLKGLTDAMSAVAPLFEFASYALDYVNMSQDHIDMMNVVYGALDNYNDNEIRLVPEKYVKQSAWLSGVSTSEALSARNTKGKYEKLISGAISQLKDEIQKKAVGNAYENLLGEKALLYKAAVRIESAVIETAFPQLKTSEESAILQYYARIMETARTCYTYKAAEKEMTEEKAEEIRLSLILFMLASKKCHKIMFNTYKAYGVDGAQSYKNMTDDIDEMLIRLYKAKGATGFMSAEDITATAEIIRHELENVSTEQIQDEPEEFTAVIYHTEDNGDIYMVWEECTVESSSAWHVWAALKSRNHMPSGAYLNSFNIDSDNAGHLDIGEGIYGINLGSMSESMLLRCIINTYIDSYSLDCLYFTVDGYPYTGSHFELEAGPHYLVTYEPSEPDADILGRWQLMYNSSPYYSCFSDIEFFSDGTFLHEAGIYDSTEFTASKGRYYIDGSTLELYYDTVAYILPDGYLGFWEYDLEAVLDIECGTYNLIFSDGNVYDNSQWPGNDGEEVDMIRYLTFGQHIKTDGHVQTYYDWELSGELS